MLEKFVVTAKCGHVGNGYYVLVDFPVLANNAKEAAQKTLKKPKVKKHLKDAISSVKKVNNEIYSDCLNDFHNNSYIKIHTKKERLMLECEPEKIIHNSKKKKNNFKCRKERVEFQMKKEKMKEMAIVC